MNLDELTQATRTKVLIFGSPKSGKTALVGKLAQNFTLHWFDLENGIKTLLNPQILAPQFRKNVKVFNVPDHRLYPVAIDTLREVFKGGLKKICNTHGKVNCAVCAKNKDANYGEIDITKLGASDILVIDSLSQLARSAMNRVVYKEISKPDGEEYKPSFTDYARQGALIEQILSLIQVIDLNIAVISHELESESLEGREKITAVAGTRNQSLTVGKYFDSMIYCTIVNKKHRAFSSSTYSPIVISGSRFDTNIDTMENPSLDSLFTRN